MPKGIEISIAANTRDFQKGTKDVERSLERVQDSLEDVAKSAQRDGDKIGDRLADGVKDGTKDASKSTERLEKSFKEMADGAKRESRQAGDDIGSNVKRGADDASDGVREIGDEAASTAKEAAASFDGSAESIGDAFQEVAANAFAGFGPVGLAAGVAAAAGIGLIINAMNEGGENAEAFKERVADLTTELIEVGNSGGPSLEYIVDRIKEMAAATEEGGQSLTDLYKISDSAASGFDKIAQAYAGNTDGLDALIAKEKAHKKSLEEEASQIDTTKDTSYGAALSRAEDSQKIVDGLEQAKDAADTAKLAEEAYIASGAAELAEKAERTAAYSDSIKEELSEAGESWETYQNAETGAIDLGAYTAALTARVEAMQNYQKNMSALHGTISEDAYNYLVQMGADAAPLIDAYVKAPLEQKQQTAEVWATLGKAGGENYTIALKREIPGQVSGPKVIIPTPDMSPVERAIAQFGTRRIVVNVEGQITKIGNQVW